MSIKPTLPTSEKALKPLQRLKPLQKPKSKLGNFLKQLHKIWRTTTVRLTAMFIAIFVGFAIVLLAFIAYQTSLQIQQQQFRGVREEIKQISLLANRSSLSTTAFAVQRLADRPGPGIYFLGDAQGTVLAGNVSDIPLSILHDEGRYELEYERGREIYGGPENNISTKGTAIVETVKLNNGLLLVIGRDVLERRYYTEVIFSTFFWGACAILALSVLAGGITARYVLRRIDGINGTTAKIMTGNFSERLPVTGRGDEFDAVAISLNEMLDKIEQLLVGMKQVTDNIAHDLKTPLTRLRNHAEAALRDNSDPDAKAKALETTIAESDALIKTFNALLLIARSEAGTSSGSFSPTNISDVVADVVELYEPVAEEMGFSITSHIQPDIMLPASRELIAQALVNLVENAFKYGACEDETNPITISLSQKPNAIILTVADRGVGIAEHDRQSVFDRFMRLDTSRTEPGAGLGLSLVAAVIKLHGGNIVFEDNLPGAKAVITFPI